MSKLNLAKAQALVVAWRFLLPLYSSHLSRHHTRRNLLATSYLLSSSPPAPSLTSYSPCPTCYRSRRRHPHSHRTHHVVLYNFPLSVTLRAELTMSQSLQSYSPRPTCYRPRRRQCAHRHSPHSCRAHPVVLIALCSSRCAHRVVLMASCSSHRAHRVVSYLPTFLCFRVKCGSSIYRRTLDRMNRTGLSHYAWNPVRVCKYDKSICYDVPCLDRQRDCGAITRVIRTPFALTQLRPEGKCSDTAASRRKMP